MLIQLQHRRKIFETFNFVEPARYEYISRVNKFLNCHKGPKIEAFKVKFDLQPNDGPDIDSWIKFAITKKVQRLELDLQRVVFNNKESRAFYSAIISNCYYFPALDSLIDKKLINNISCLTSLNLNFVDMTGETFEYLMSNCPNLEYVGISNSPSLVGVRVVAPCPKLKHFEIEHCNHLKFIDIYSAENLTSFSYNGSEQTRLCLRNVSNLPDVSLGGDYCRYMIARFHELPVDFSQIEKLKLNACKVSQHALCVHSLYC